MVPPSGIVTFLFTDIEGSTSLWAANPEAMSASLRVHDEILREGIESRGGYLFTTAGDSYAAAFERASDAVAAAEAMQITLEAASWPGPILRVRMGLHLGEAEERGGDYFGSVVNVTARIESAGHGGQILMSDVVRTTAGVRGTDLGVHQLRDVSEPVRLFQLGEGTFPPLRVIERSLSNLPARPTRLIGREDDVARIRQLLPVDRLVTITGVGGSGKTRVALAAGDAEIHHRSGGVWFVDLSAVMNGADVMAAIANAVGLNARGRDPTGDVLHYLRDRNALVILDNCEHVIEECAAFAELVLAAPGRTSLLATSREALDVEGERTLALASLPCDNAQSAGVQLFIDRATMADTDFAPTEDDTATIASLCTRLDGMPLAIELAAARITVMTPVELLAGLDNRFQLLTGGRRRHRQRTLEATLDWSYDLLNPDEQRVFRSIGVFTDGFDLDAVASITQTSRLQTTNLIGGLVAKSLVRRADRGGMTRFALLETVKAYAEDRLAQASEAEHVRNLHLAHFHRVAHRYGRTILPELRVGLHLRNDTSNISSAFEWAATTDQWTTAIDLLLGSAGAYLLDGRGLEVRTLLERSIAHVDDINPDLADYARAALSEMQAMMSDWYDVWRTAAEMVTSSRPHVRALGHAWLGVSISADTYRRHFALAHSELEQLRAAGPNINTEIVAQMIPHLQSLIVLLEGDHAKTFQLNRQAIATADAADYQTVNVVWGGVTGAAYCLVSLGEPAKAIETLARLEPLQLPFATGVVRPLAHLALGDLDEARSLIRLHVSNALTGRRPQEASDSVYLLAALAEAEDDHDTATDLLLHMGRPRWTAFAYDLAQRLGIAEAYATHTRPFEDPTQAHEHADLGSTLSMTTLRQELRRRGWSESAVLGSEYDRSKN